MLSRRAHGGASIVRTTTMSRGHPRHARRPLHSRQGSMGIDHGEGIRMQRAAWQDPCDRQERRLSAQPSKRVDTRRRTTCAMARNAHANRWPSAAGHVASTSSFGLVTDRHARMAPGAAACHSGRPERPAIARTIEPTPARAQPTHRRADGNPCHSSLLPRRHTGPV